MEKHEQHHEFSREQKTDFVLLFVFAILVVGLGFLQMRNTIYSPFVVKLEEQQIVNLTDSDETIRLQSIDTDKDGINDYEELNFYGTSPYLPDTDSDSINDKQEIEAGTDPLCPEGTKCYTQTETEKNANQPGLESFGANVQANALQAGLLGGSTTGTPNYANTNVESLLTDPAQLRALLLSSGQISKDALDAFSDQELLQMAQGIAQDYTQSQGSGQVNTNSQGAQSENN